MGLRMERTRPLVDNPNSVTDWTCPRNEHGDTHHVGADMRCRYCGHGLGALIMRQAALATIVHEKPEPDGLERAVPVWKITAWAPEPDAVLVYFEDAGWPRTYGRMLVPKSVIELIRQAGLGDNTV